MLKNNLNNNKLKFKIIKYFFSISKIKKSNNKIESNIIKNNYFHYKNNY